MKTKGRKQKRRKAPNTFLSLSHNQEKKAQDEVAALLHE